MASNKDNTYSLFFTENYKNQLTCSIEEATKKYAELIIDYYKCIIENIKITKTSLLKFIIIRGLDTIKHIFFYLLYLTKNLHLTFYHCQKSFYFYIEFVEQISEDEKTFLQLTSRDAIIYVYKKTIYDINKSFVKTNKQVECKLREKLNAIKHYVNIYDICLLKVIHTNNIYPFYITFFETLNANKNTNIEYITLIETIVDNLYYKIDNVDTFFDVNHQILKYISENSNNNNDIILAKKMEHKIKSDEFDVQIKESFNIFIHWLLIC